MDLEKDIYGDGSNDLTSHKNLERIKDNISDWKKYFTRNIIIFNSIKRFIHDSNYTPSEFTDLSSQRKPTLQFNLLSSFIYRQLGQFFKQEPDAKINDENGNYSQNSNVIPIIEGHIQYELNSKESNQQKYRTYEDLLCGYAAIKCYTKYKSPFNFEQTFIMERKDPTLCGWDINAQHHTKRDGYYCFEAYPYDEKSFKKEFPETDYKKIFQQDRTDSKDNSIWGYSLNSKKIIVVYDYYEKKDKKITIVEYSENSTRKTMEESQFKRKVETEKAFKGENSLELPIMIQKRKTCRTSIMRYRLIETEILSVEETDYSDLPIVYFGKSTVIRDGNNQSPTEVVNAYVKNALDAQKLINYSGSCLAAYLEAMRTNPIMMAEESMPDNQNFLNIWLNPHQSGLLVYKSMSSTVQGQMLPQPSPLLTQPLPPQVSEIFMGGMALIQNLLGSYDASLGINDNQLSGKAMEVGAIQSDSSSMPYIAEFIMGLEQVFQIYINMFGKIHTRETNIPFVNKDGKKSLVPINTNPQNTMDFNPDELKVDISVGASTSVEKQKSLNMLLEISKFPKVGQFINDEGTETIFRNIDINGGDSLMSKYPKWSEKQQQIQQMAIKNNPQIMKNQIEMQKVQLDAEKHHDNVTLNAMEIQRQTKELLLEQQKIQMSHIEKMMQQQTEQFVNLLDLKKEMIIHNDKHSLNKKDQVHRHLGDAIDRHHKISKENEPQPEKEMKDDKGSDKDKPL